MSTLDELAMRHGTDKSSRYHNYCRYYDELFTSLRDKPIIMLELGVCYGQSIRMWADYFTHPDTMIHGIDNGGYGEFQGAPPPQVTLWEGDQAQFPAAWEDPMLDIVVDDASHDPVKTEASFRLWFPAVKPGGFYVVEDISNFDIRWLELLVWETVNHTHSRWAEVEWMRFSHDLCVMRKAVGPVVVRPRGDSPGAVLRA